MCAPDRGERVALFAGKRARESQRQGPARAGPGQRVGGPKKSAGSVSAGGRMESAPATAGVRS